MAEHERLVLGLARAYSLSEILPVDDGRILEELHAVADALDGPLVLRIDGHALVVEDERVSDEDGATAEMVGDLELAGIVEIRVFEEVEADDLLTLIRSLRRGSGRGDGERTARELTDGLARFEVEIADGGGFRSRAARSVAGLFPDAPSTPDESAAPTALKAAVDDYLGASPSERPGRADAVRGAATEAKEAGHVEGIVSAVRRLAVEAVAGEDRDPATLELARRILTPGVATRLALQLGELRDEEVRDALVEACGELGSEMATALAEALADTGDRSARRTYIRAMEALGSDARSQVEKMLAESRWFVVRNGVRILGGIGGEDDIQHLTASLAHDDARVRLETVRALGRIGGEDAGMLLLGMLDDPNPDVRAATATALGALEVERAVKVLLDRLEREDSEKVQVQILRALGAIGDPGAVPAIEKRAVATFFSRPSRPLRIAGYRALASIGTPHAMELLEEARDDRDEKVRGAVVSLLDARET